MSGDNLNGAGKAIGIYYEQPNWFVPLFAAMDAKGANWKKIDARFHSYDPTAAESEFSLIFNRMSPSAWQRGMGHGIFYTLNYLKHLEDKGVRVVNGYRAFVSETSKALQLNMLERLGLPTYVVGGRGYWAHPQVVDMVEYLRALANPRDEQA